MSQILTLCAVLFLLPILFRLAIKIRLGIPMLYIVLTLTVLHDWTRANPELADGILFALVGLVALSWVLTGARKVCGFIGQCCEDRAEAELFTRRVRQARANGEYAVSADDFWY